MRRLKALEDENAKPTDNRFIEAFNGRVRAECLSAHWFQTLDDARSKMEDWRRYYNEERPHGAIRNKSPIMLQNHDGPPARHRKKAGKI
jgi:putative transposase